MSVKYEHFMVPGVFLDKVTPDILFRDKAVAPCDVLVDAMFQIFLDDGNI